MLNAGRAIRDFIPERALPIQMTDLVRPEYGLVRVPDPANPDRNNHVVAKIPCDHPECRMWRVHQL